MKAVWKKIKENDVLIYYFAIFFVCIKFFIERTTLFTIDDKILNAVFVALFLVKMLTQKYNKKELIITII